MILLLAALAIPAVTGTALIVGGRDSTTSSEGNANLLSLAASVATAALVVASGPFLSVDSLEFAASRLACATLSWSCASFGSAVASVWPAVTLSPTLTETPVTGQVIDEEPVFELELELELELDEDDAAALLAGCAADPKVSE